ncbi:MAG: sulfatase-like hydrolase/transferase [Pseudomonadota bacterium]
MKHHFTRLTALFFPGRCATIGILLLSFFALNTVLRVAFLIFEQDPAMLTSTTHFFLALLVGLCFDLAAFSCVAWLFALLLAYWPETPRATMSLKAIMHLLVFSLCGLALFTVVGECLFWNEFSSRYNFIAVDYLVYTHEVIGNIVESYNMPLIISLLTLSTLIFWYGLSSPVQRALNLPRPQGRAKFSAVFIWLALPFVLLSTLDQSLKGFTEHGKMRELASNGYYELFRAFHLNELSYADYYALRSKETTSQHLASLFNSDKLESNALPNARWIHPTGEAKLLNVVMVSIESFSAEFMESFGASYGPNLTPNMDRYAKEGLLFTRLYATGTRTVRGLEALTLSIPPTPGNSIVKRPNNQGLFSVGHVFREKGYETLFLYGGYAYFDNMKDFYEGLGYRVVDRLALSPEEITQETIWGVADENLFQLTLKTLDEQYNKNQKFYAHVMTTSNHRPYHYPEGRIDIPSATGGRLAGVKYTDWAIGDFIETARTKPWFDDTIFVFVADHTHRGRGKTDLPLENYHIPLVFYAPKWIEPQVVDTLASQIDTSPTLLGLLNFDYRTQFFGHDILKEGKDNPRALLANYQTVGLYTDGTTIELRPKQQITVRHDKDAIINPLKDAMSIERTISYYQTASQAFQDGRLKVSSRE